MPRVDVKSIGDRRHRRIDDHRRNARPVIAAVGRSVQPGARAGVVRLIGLAGADVESCCRCDRSDRARGCRCCSCRGRGRPIASRGSVVFIASSVRHTPPPAVPTHRRHGRVDQARRRDRERGDAAGDVLGAARRPDSESSCRARGSSTSIRSAVWPRYATPRNTQYRCCAAAVTRGSPTGAGIRLLVRAQVVVTERRELLRLLALALRFLREQRADSERQRDALDATRESERIPPGTPEPRGTPEPPEPHGTSPHPAPQASTPTRHRHLPPES